MKRTVQGVMLASALVRVVCSGGATQDETALASARALPNAKPLQFDVPRVPVDVGELLPAFLMPADLDPQWPSPSLIVHSAPFLGAIALPQGIVAYPCGR